MKPSVWISARIAHHAAAAPHRLAIDDGKVRLSFGELDRRAGLLAAHLREAGAGPERCIGLLLERSTEFVVAALAVLRSGAAYLPLDSSTPADRAGFILGDAGAPVLLTHRGKAKNLAPGPWRVMEIDGADALRLTTPVSVEPTGTSLAYLIYTSGSTGQPKGVEITHANLCNLIEWHQAAFGVTAVDRASQVAGLGFDAAAWEIWPHLTAGASLHIADEMTRRSPQALHDWLIAQKITISFVPTVLAEQLIHANWPKETALRTLLTGADTLHRRPAKGLPFAFVNNYGPTECTVVATSGTVKPDGDGQSRPSIGKAIANAAVLILDEALRPVRAGEAGELCVAGALVGRGYRNNPEMTASRFVTYTSESETSMRIYRTGDRARMLADGEIEFLGRLDDQVKIRGYRIEPGEIVACLDRCHGVESSAVMVREGINGAVTGPTLVAYVVPHNGSQLNGSDLRDYLARHLPDYMIPTYYVRMTAFPLTANGKLDKSALPAPGAENLLPNRDALPANNGSGPLQQQIAAMVASLLGQPSVESGANFFLIGGHSMLGVQLVAKIRDTFGVKLSLRQLFSAPTVAALSAEVARLTETTHAGATHGKN